MADLRFTGDVHVANPDTGQAEQFRKGQSAPEWVSKLVDEGLLTDGLISEAGAGALPLTKHADKS